MKEFNNVKEMKPYYNAKTNTYEFECDVQFNFNVDVMANITAWDIKAWDIIAWDIIAWDIIAWNIEALNIIARDIKAWDIEALNIIAWNIEALNINAEDINAWDINAKDINAEDINARDINAKDINAEDINALNINYYAVCFAYKNINCTSIKGHRNNAKHFVLDGKITIKPKTYKIKIDDKEIELSEESYNNFKRQFKEE